jgi:putative transcriptional regulator
MAGLKEAQAHLRGELKLQERVVAFPETMNVKAVRARTGLSQSEFASRFHFNLRTLQEWEQGRAFPDAAVRAYLTVIARNHAAVERALAS